MMKKDNDKSKPKSNQKNKNFLKKSIKFYDTFDEFMDNEEKTSPTVWFFETALVIVATALLIGFSYETFNIWQAKGSLSIMEGLRFLVALWLFKHQSESWWRIKKKRAAHQRANKKP